MYGGGIEAQQTEAKGTVLIENAEQLMNFSKVPLVKASSICQKPGVINKQGEESAMEDFVKGLAEAGVSVVISGGAVSEIALHFLDK